MSDINTTQRRYMSPEEYQKRSLELTHLYQIWQQHKTFMKILEYDKKSFMYDPSLHQQIHYELDDVSINTPTEPTDVLTSENMLEKILEAKKQLEAYGHEHSHLEVTDLFDMYNETEKRAIIDSDAFEQSTSDCIEMSRSNMSWDARYYFLPKNISVKK